MNSVHLILTDRYRSNYSQQPKVYYDKTADQYKQFKNYKTNYYNNDQFEQEDSWVNYIINENQTFSETYKELFSELNKNVDINYAVEQTSYHCHWCSEFFSSNNDLYKHVKSSHNLSNTKTSWALTSKSEVKLAYFISLNKELV